MTHAVYQWITSIAQARASFELLGCRVIEVTGRIDIFVPRPWMMQPTSIITLDGKVEEVNYKLALEILSAEIVETRAQGCTR